MENKHDLEIGGLYKVNLDGIVPPIWQNTAGWENNSRSIGKIKPEDSFVLLDFKERFYHYTDKQNKMWFVVLKVLCNKVTGYIFIEEENLAKFEKIC